MPVLANNELRLNHLKYYLDSVGVILPKGVSIKLEGERFYFEGLSDEALASFSTQLLSAFSDKESEDRVTTVSVDDILTQDISEGTHQDADKQATYRQAASAMLPVILGMGQRVKLNEKTLSARLPLLPGLSAPLKQLQYKHISFSYDDALTLDLSACINAQTSPVVVVKLSSQQAPVVCLKSDVLSNRVFYKVSEIKGDKTKVEVTPFFVVPRNLTAPDYHFVLDTSYSMRASISTLKDAVKKMAGFIFDFEPKATISITTFASAVHPLGRYQRHDLWTLTRDVNKLSAEGSTVLYRAAREEIEKLKGNSSTHHNVLLFTDGEDMSVGDMDHTALKAINETIAIDKKLSTHNKFYVINYAQKKQAPIIEEMVTHFHSSLIDAESADFIAALQDKKEMQRFAATRQLFSCRLSVANQKEAETTEITELSLDQSGQLVELPKMQVQKGAHISTNITDARGVSVAKSEMSLPAPEKGIAQVAAIVRSQSPVFRPEPQRDDIQASLDEQNRHAVHQGIA